ncbi:hypothetical protein HEQ62_04375 [Haematospirillum jordaniae]|nr:hypothetical protein [Haematospirillum jordaniae]NKD46328.1 hypothetical protein [Haematospirillum jordaniae]NKD56828.1 hypothetical protein [Haematospirillum jordaniae]NKD59016.1 hypothetical protein [Haematospirillum jordaniae]NKD66753.1 hypothetical protein [Haematospirillum jordaniae]NKD79018.1 hypothetical protein [Haematospirillum jordaniae]
MSSFMIRNMYGLNARDTIDYAGESRSIVASLEQSYVSIQGQRTSGWVEGARNVIGGSAMDNIHGDSHNNVLVGRGGDDLLSGGKGDDTLVGGSGNDFLIGGKGADTITGGPGADKFVYWRASDTQGDVITDFNHGQGDIINFIFTEEEQYAHNHPKPGYVPDPEQPMPLPLNGTAEAPHSLWYQVAENGKDLHLFGDTDGQVDTHEISMTLQGVTSLQSSDFVFEYWV